MKQFMIAFLLSFVMISQSFACSCMAPEGAEQGFEQSEVIFAGKVVSLSESFNKGSGFLGASKEIQFEMYDIWKGERPKNNTIFTARDGGGCGYGFALGQEYLVYADKHEGRVSVSLCSNTKKLADAGEDIEVLAELTQKKIVNQNDRYPKNDSHLWLVILIVLGSLSGLVFWKKHLNIQK